MSNKTDSEFVSVSFSDLRAILFWAGVGVSMSEAGSYGGKIEDLIEKYRLHIKMKPSEFARSPHFGVGPHYSALDRECTTYKMALKAIKLLDYKTTKGLSIAKQVAEDALCKTRDAQKVKP